MTLRIERLRIDGFGRLEDVEHELSPRLNVLVGPNEVGKSTLLGFIRGVLFGFETARSPLPRYEPEHGTFGGEMLVRVNNETWSVRREGGPRKRAGGLLTVRGPRGELIPEARLADALCGIDRELYFQVFAFGLSELATFEHLARSGTVSEALFSAGMSGALRFRDARQRLRDCCDALWSKEARTRELSRALGELESVRQRLAALEDLPREHGAAAADIARLEQELPALDGALEAGRAELAEVERLRRSREALLAWAAAQEALGSLPPELDRVPDGARSALEALLSRAEACERAMASARLALADAEEAAERARAHLPVEGREPEVKAALQAVARRASQRESFPARAAASAARSEEAARALQSLGLGWTPEALLGRELGAAARAPLLDLKKALDEADASVRALQSEVRRAEADRDRLAHDRESLERELERLPAVPVAAWRARLRDVEEVRSARAELSRRQGEVADLEQRLREAAGSPPEPRASFPGWLLAVALAGTAALGAALARWAGVEVGAAAGALVGALLVGFQRLSTARLAAALAAHEEAEDQRRHAREGLEARMRAAAFEEEAQARRLSSACERLGLALEAAGAEALSECAAAALEGVQRSEVRAQLESRRLELVAALGRARADAEAAAATVEGARAARREVEERIQAALSERGLPPGLSLERALDLWAEAAAAQARLREARAGAAAAAAEAADHAAAEGRLSGLAEALGERGPVDVVAAALEARLVEAEARRRARAEAEERLRNAKEAIPPLQHASADVREQLRWLVEAAECEDAEALRRLLPRAEARAALLDRARELELQLRSGTFAPPEQAVARMEALGGAAALDAAAERCAARLAELEARRREAAEQLGRRRERLSALEQDGEARQLRLEEERLAARAGALAERYAVDRLALELLERAKLRHDAEHQPRLLQLAGERLSVLTSGKYARVQASDDGAVLFAVTREGKEVSAEALSRGTREQLYLAFRLAVIAELHEARGAVPVVLDDVLVNFDLERARGAARALRDLSQTHQVLAFTCHASVAEVLVDAGAERVDLTVHQRSLFKYGTA
ncbi:MAG TPA: AAA family ATPase [Myxococcales bacterium]|nr:AAA family ATPase [Myxococcales bacterium]